MGAPDEHRCTAHRTRSRKGKPPGQCEKPAEPGADVCYMHSGILHLGPPPDERRCGATVKNRDNAGERCPNWAMQEQSVCKRHGGGSPQAIKKAARKIAEVTLNQQANKLLVTLGADPVDNPLTALSELAGEVLAFKNALGAKVNALEEIRYKGGAGEQLRAEVALYERAIDRAGNLLGNIARLNIDERLAAINEKQAGVVIAAIEAALAHAGITGEAAVEAKVVAARRLRAL